MSQPRVMVPHSLRRLLLFLALLAIPFSILCLSIDLSDLHRYPGKDLLPKIAGARRLLAGRDPYAVSFHPAEPEYFRTNQIPFNTPAAFLLYMPLSPLPYRTQRTIYFGVGLAAAVTVLMLLMRYACVDAQQRLLVWIVFAAFVFCSYSLRLELERGQYYALLLLLATHTAVVLRNRWTGWLSAVPTALLILIRPTYGLVLVFALLLRAQRWALRVAVIAGVLFGVTLVWGGTNHWLAFAHAVRTDSANVVANLPAYCHAAAPEPSSVPLPTNVIDNIDFSQGLVVHSITGTFLGVSMIHFGMLSPRLAFLCGYPSPAVIGRINSALLPLVLVTGFVVCLLARRKQLPQNTLVAGALLWPILAEMLGPERNLYTALLEFLPLTFLLLDWDSLRARRISRIAAWTALLVLGILPPIIYQAVSKLAVREAMSVAILILLPLALALYSAGVVLRAPAMSSEPR